MFWNVMKLIATIGLCAILWGYYEAGHPQAVWVLLVVALSWLVYGLALCGFTGLWKHFVAWQLDMIRMLDKMHEEGQAKAERRITLALAPRPEVTR